MVVELQPAFLDGPLFQRRNRLGAGGNRRSAVPVLGWNHEQAFRSFFAAGAHSHWDCGRQDTSKKALVSRTPPGGRRKPCGALGPPCGSASRLPLPAWGGSWVLGGLQYLLRQPPPPKRDSQGHGAHHLNLWFGHHHRRTRGRHGSRAVGLARSFLAGPGSSSAFNASAIAGQRRDAHCLFLSKEAAVLAIQERPPHGGISPCRPA